MARKKLFGAALAAYRKARSRRKARATQKKRAARGASGFGGSNVAKKRGRRARVARAVARRAVRRAGVFGGGIAADMMEAGLGGLGAVGVEEVLARYVPANFQDTTYKRAGAAFVIATLVKNVLGRGRLAGPIRTAARGAMVCAARDAIQAARAGSGAPSIARAGMRGYNDPVGQLEPGGLGQDENNWGAQGTLGYDAAYVPQN
jgi:hypothetical protein